MKSIANVNLLIVVTVTLLTVVAGYSVAGQGSVDESTASSVVDNGDFPIYSQAVFSEEFKTRLKEEMRKLSGMNSGMWVYRIHSHCSVVHKLLSDSGEVRTFLENMFKIAGNVVAFLSDEVSSLLVSCISYP